MCNAIRHNLNPDHRNHVCNYSTASAFRQALLVYVLFVHYRLTCPIVVAVPAARHQLEHVGRLGQPSRFALVNRVSRQNLRPVVILFGSLACIWAIVW
jgi:hypothetical protein